MNTYKPQLLILAALTGLVAIHGCIPAAQRPKTDLQSVQGYFPTATAVRPTGDDTSPVHVIEAPDGTLGYVVVEMVKSRSNLFPVLVVMDANYHVLSARVTSYAGSHGRGVLRPRFAKQFKGKGPDDKLSLGDDIDSVSGATSSCQAMTAGVRRAIRRAKAAG